MGIPLSQGILSYLWDNSIIMRISANMETKDHMKVVSFVARSLSLFWCDKERSGFEMKNIDL